MIETQRITEAMGGPAVLGQTIGSLRLLEAAVHRGLPKTALTQVVARAVAEPGERRRLLHEIVPEATYKHRQVLRGCEKTTFYRKIATSRRSG